MYLNVSLSYLCSKDFKGIIFILIEHFLYLLHVLYSIICYTYIYSFILSSSACNASVCTIIRFLVNTPTILVLKISNYIIIIDYVCFLNMVSMMFMYVCVSFLNVSKPGQNFNCQILYIITKDRILRHQNTNYSIPTIIFFLSLNG